ncbi:hypothetical protein OF83DRAFT_232346 [Amylostereum chailletii]|nr:hypothetical protein OF83DRAFT_232346 [Amylostereum chailletii]
MSQPTKISPFPQAAIWYFQLSLRTRIVFLLPSPFPPFERTMPVVPWPLLLPSLLLGLLPHPSFATIVYPTECQSPMTWSYNSLGQSPCAVFAILEGVCNNGNFVLDSLQQGNAYDGPSGADDGDMCKCNTVAYSLISACSACQAQGWITWDSWHENCSNLAPTGLWPLTVPNGTAIPHWAAQDVDISGIWDNTTAFTAGMYPEVIASNGSIIGPSTTIHAGSSPTSSPSSSQDKGSSIASAIVGGVVGGVVGACVITATLIWLLRRRRRGSPVRTTSADYKEVPNEPMEQDTKAMPLALPMTPRRYYDPSDPTTFPNRVGARNFRLLPEHHRRDNSWETVKSTRGYSAIQYKGLPEL